MTQELRPYQRRAISDVRAAFARSRSVVLVVPCGGGKTTIAAEIIAQATARSKNVLFLAHRKELVTQASKRLTVPHGIIRAGVVAHREHSVQVASKDTLIRRKLPPADLIILDECHRSVSESWRKLISNYPDAYLLGLTASPVRLDGKGLSSVYKELVVGATSKELVEQGFLIIPTVYSHPAPDLGDIHTRAGDYAEDELALTMNKPKLLGDIVEHWKSKANGMQTVVFAVNIAHSQSICQAFRDANIPAGHVDGKTPSQARDRLLSDLRARRILVLCNVGILTEGWDLPSLECVVIARPTKSLMLHLQCIGRAMRACSMKDGALVLDHAGNTNTHGFVEEEREWTLAGVKKKPGAAPVKNCPSCFRTLSSATMTCPECGHVFLTEARPIDHAPGELILMLPTLDKTTEYARLVDTASKHGYRLGWARNKFKDRFGTWPRNVAHIDARYVCQGHEMEEKEYGSRRVRRCGKCLREEGAMQATNGPSAATTS